MRMHGVCRLSFLALLGLAVLQPASAQVPNRADDADELLDWRRHILYPEQQDCRTDEDGLRRAFGRHGLNSVGFNVKVKTGEFAVPDPERQRLLERLEQLGSPSDAIARNLRLLGDTAALIYDYGFSHGAVTFCAWLFDQSGLVARAKTEFGSGDAPSIRFREALNVNARAYARLRASGPPDSGINAVPFSPGHLSRSSEQILMPALQRAIITRSYRRLLILPVADLGNVPFAIVNMGDPAKTLIDYVAPIILPDIEALLAPERSSSRKTHSRRSLPCPHRR